VRQFSVYFATQGAIFSCVNTDVREGVVIYLSLHGELYVMVSAV
jgi:hypothetical protein